MGQNSNKIDRGNNGRMIFTIVRHMSAISKQIYTKFHRGIIKGISLKTFAKMFGVELYNGVAGNLMEWSYDI